MGKVDKNTRDTIRPKLRPSFPGDDRQTLLDEPKRGGDAVTQDGLDSSEHEVAEEDGGDGGDGEDATGEREYPVPAGWDLDDQTNEEFWTKVFAVEHAQEEGLAAFKAALRAHGFLSEGHFEFVRERFTERHGGDTNFTQSMMNARVAHQHAQLRQAVGAELLEPIEDVTLEIYATIQARRGALPQSPWAFAGLLAEHQLDEKKWARVDKLWKARMTDPANAVAANSVNEAYRSHFAAAYAQLDVRPTKTKGRSS